MNSLKDYENADTISISTLALEERVQQERLVEINQLNSLSQKVNFLHTNLLYYQNSNSKMGSACYNAWKILVKKVGGTPNGWRDLGHALGLTQDDLNYIMHAVKEDPVDMVLKVFRENEKATLDKLLDAFIKLKRYDILKAVEEPLCDIASYFNKDDSGYYSKEKCSSHREIVSLKNLPNDLPVALSKMTVTMEKEQRQPKQPEFKPTVNKSESKSNDGPILFLTYAQDGLPTAINIQEYVENWENNPNVQVITLNNKKGDIYRNPEMFIREYFEKADIIIPIITTGYFEAIKSHDPNVPNTTDNLDHKYVSFVYNLIINNYVHATGCLNTKVRSVLPQNSNIQLYKTIAMYPDLMPWTYEVNFDEQFQVFLKKEYL